MLVGKSSTGVVHIAIWSEAIPEADVPEGWTSRCGCVFRLDTVEEGEPNCASCDWQQKAKPRTVSPNGYGWVVRTGRGRYRYNPRLLKLEEDGTLSDT
jgi:hypothetical protein